MTKTDVETPPAAVNARGSLTVQSRAAERLVRGVVAGALRHDTDPGVEILSLDDEGIELRSTITLAYPSEPLSAVLARLRRDVASEVARQLGRPVRRIDLVVGSFATEPPTPARRVV